MRGDHGNVQYRLDGVQLPEGLSLFNNILATRYADQMSLLTGALPAQYGLHTAGIVDITVKSGTTNPGAEVSVTGGSRDYSQPAFSYGGRTGAIDYFAAGQYIHNGLGIENPTSSFAPIHDDTDQWYGLAKITGIVDENTRLAFIAGGASSRFQIPNVPFQTPNFAVNGQTDFNSSILDQRQWEKSYFAIASLQKSYQDVNFQLSGFARYSSLSYQPDPFGDLAFNGIAPWTKRTSFATGVQGDGSWKVHDKHTLRGGFLVQRERATSSPRAIPAADARPRQSGRRPDSVRPALRLHRQFRSHRLDLQRLPAGRMADRAHRHGEFRPAFRRHQCRHPGEPAEPAHQRRVAAQRDVHLPRRLFALLHAAAAPPGQRQLDRDSGRHRRRARSDDRTPR